MHAPLVSRGRPATRPVRSCATGSSKVPWGLACRPIIALDDRSFCLTTIAA